ncbi:MAG: LysR family transcriptional regulator [Hypericibacter sp.]
MRLQLADIDLKLLRVFCTIVEAGGFTPAQTRLNLSQSRISSLITDLEARLGMRLCQRGRVGFRLTDKGQIVYEAAQRLFARLSDFNAEVGTLRGAMWGELHIGVVDSTSTNPDCRLVEAIRVFKAQAPEVTLQLQIAGPHDLERAVLDGRLQAAIGAFHHHVAGLAYAPLFQERQTLYCGRGHPLFERPDRALTVAEIETAAFADRGYMEGARRRLPFAPKAATTTDYMEALAMLVLSGHYVAYLPAHYAAAWVAQGEMRPLMASKLSFNSAFEVVKRRGAMATAVLSAFLEALETAHPHPARSARRNAAEA